MNGLPTFDFCPIVRQSIHLLSFNRGKPLSLTAYFNFCLGGRIWQLRCPVSEIRSISYSNPQRKPDASCNRGCVKKETSAIVNKAEHRIAATVKINAL